MTGVILMQLVEKHLPHLADDLSTMSPSNALARLTKELDMPLPKDDELLLHIEDRIVTKLKMLNTYRG